MNGSQRSTGRWALAGAALRWMGFVPTLLAAVGIHAQGGDAQVRTKADDLFAQAAYAEALPLYSQLVSLEPADRVLNYRFGACLLFGGDDKERAIGHLKYAIEDPAIPAEAWYWMGRAYHLNYRFREALVAYQRYKGVADPKQLSALPVAALEQQCRNGQKLLANLKEITVRSKVEVDAREFFRFYDLSDIGGRIVVTPDELKTSLDKKNKLRSLVYLPQRPGPIYYSSYGKDGRTGLDIYRTELMPDGRFSTPVKLAGFINTEEDEDFPFMHPDGKTFYFSSRGHSSMGGYDVFKAMYDKGLDAFGRPENLDFAVNTPDDDVFFVVDATHGEACFASGRSSSQGMYHVYRVATERMPLVITVLKGTFANEFDEQDRKARIVVEDALTREQVANVRTDMNGGYVLALPRSGRFRFMVECGPSGRTHVGMVDVPRSDGPRGYRQEMTLVRNGDQEKLMIRNYFDLPLEDDLIELAMAEIRRRARLDVSEEKAVADAAPEQLQAFGDVLTRAGFTGEVDKPTALRMARNDATAEEQLAAELASQQRMAYELALEATEEAERSAREAQDLVEQAGREDDEEARNAVMARAARARQQSREASLRARAAQRAAQDLEVEELASRQRAAEASKLAADLDATLGAGRDEEAMPHLVTLKKRLDEKSGPDAKPDIAEAARRSVAEQERLADRAIQQANDKRVEDGELVDRINRLKREQASARSRARQEELDGEIAQLEEQLRYLRRETDAAFAKAAALENETSVMRGTASLLRYLSSSGNTSTGGTAPTATQVAAIGQRIAGAESRVATLAIDERFDALLTTTPAEVEARTFNWTLASSAATAEVDERSATRAAERSTQNDARTTTTRSSSVQGGEAPGRDLRQGVATDVPVTSGAPDGTAAAAQGAPEGGTNGPPVVRSDGGARSQAAGQTDRAGQAGQAEVPSGGGAGTEGSTSADQRVARQEGASVPPAGLTPEQVRNAEVAPKDGREPAATGEAFDNDPFLVENQLAELRQLMQAERNRTRRDSLQVRIDELERRRTELNAVADGTPPETTEGTERLRREVGLTPGEAPDLSRVPLTFEASVTAEDIRSSLFADYERDKQMLAQIDDGDQRAESLQGLELMMADSLRSEMTRQVALLELDPTQAERVLPRLDRLRRLRDEHLAMAAQHLTDRRNEQLATGAGRTPGGDAGVEAAKAAAIDELYVAFPSLNEDVYGSQVAFKSDAVTEALAQQETDLRSMEVMELRIDSVDALIASTPPGRERERQQRTADKLQDELLILRTDVGQRSAFLTREEWTSATDSIRSLEQLLSTNGVASNEPILVQAVELQADAQRRRGQATDMRRLADRERDIVARDSLYRKAYTTELLALRDLQRAIILEKHLLDPDHVPGEDLSYEQVAAKVFDAGAAPSPEGVAITENRGGGEAAPPVRDAGVGNEAQQDGRSEVSEPTAADNDAARATTGTGEGVAEPLAMEVPRTERATDAGREGRTAQEASATTAVQGGGIQADGAERVAGSVPTTAEERVVDEQARSAGREIGLAQARAAEGQLDETARRPLATYAELLRPEEVLVTDLRMEDLPDPAVLAQQSASLARDGDLLERQASELRQQAAEQEARTATVKRKERAALQQMAIRNRQVADSLEAASVVKREQSLAIIEEQREVEQLLSFRERLVKFYYLSNDERAIIMENPDGSRFFEARVRSQEQDEAAAEAEAAAKANRDLGNSLRRDADIVQLGATGSNADRDGERARVLNERAGILLARADSLDAIALQLRTAARANEAKAGEVLAAMDPNDASRLADLERGARATVGLRVDTRTAEQAAPEVRRTGEDRSADELTRPPAPAATTERVPGVLVADLFQFRPAGSRTDGGTTFTEEMPGGIVYTVQVGAFRNAVAEGTFGDLSPVMTERLENGLTRYKAGLFTSLGSATTARDQVRARGYGDAFVVVYRDGRRITLAEAQRELAAADPLAQTARPASSTTTSTGQVPGVPIGPERPAAIPPGDGQPAVDPATAGRVDAVTTVPVQAPSAGERTVTRAPDPQEEAAAVLASYPPTATAIVGAFAPAPERAAYYNEPGAAPARQVETIRGLFFTVQVGVYSRPVPLDKLFNITPLNSELTSTSKIRYTTGIHLSEDLARVRRDQAVELGVKDAFITAYLNGERIPMRDARVLLDRFGAEILARP